MPEPTVADVHVSTALTMISVAYVQDQANYIADKVFPMVPVQHRTDIYYTWTKADWFRDEAQQRADATESAGTGVNLTTASYLAAVWALHQDIGTQVRANADPAVNLDVASSEQLMQKLLIRRDRIFMTKYMATGKWGTDITGTAGGVPGSSTPAYWDDDAGSDPFTDIAVGQTTILQNTGMMPNRLVLSWNAYQALRKHPLVVDRIKYTTKTFAGTITPDLLAACFDVEMCLVSKAVYNTAQQGVAASMSFAMGKHALLCYAAPSPSLMTPTAGYTFAWQGFTGTNSLGIRVSQIPMNQLGVGTVRNEAEMAFDMQIVGTDLGYFFSGITLN